MRVCLLLIRAMVLAGEITRQRARRLIKRGSRCALLLIILLLLRTNIGIYVYEDPEVALCIYRVALCIYRVALCIYRVALCIYRT